MVRKTRRRKRLTLPQDEERCAYESYHYLPDVPVRCQQRAWRDQRCFAHHPDGVALARDKRRAAREVALLADPVGRARQAAVQADEYVRAAEIAVEQAAAVLQHVTTAASADARVRAAAAAVVQSTRVWSQARESAVQAGEQVQEAIRQAKAAGQPVCRLRERDRESARAAARQAIEQAKGVLFVQAQAAGQTDEQVAASRPA